MGDSGMECYFDNSATTKPTAKAVSAAVKMLESDFGNPSSLHRKGDEAQQTLDESRRILAKALGCRADEVVFTSGGTESNNMAVMGAAQARKRLGNRVVTSCVEHPSVLECMKRLEEEGFEVKRLPVNREGMVERSALSEAVNGKTVLVSLMSVNNETGSIMPVQEIKSIVKAAGAPALIHTDAVQAFGKLPLNVRTLGVDLLTVSSHKVHGPKGCGALYVGNGVRLSPYVLGGGQESGLRSGTQNMPGIAGFAAAVSGLGNTEETGRYIGTLKEKLLKELADVENLTVNSPDGFPYILNLSLCGVPSEVLRNFLSESGVYVSTGSACSKGHRSYVLTAMGLPAEVIDSAIRISFSRFNTEDEVLYLAECLKRANTSLRKRK